MASADSIRNSIIDRLLTISDKEYLAALFKLVESSSIGNEKLTLSKEQRIMLQISEQDIIEGRLISQEKIDKEDVEWLKNL